MGNSTDFQLVPGSRDSGRNKPPPLPADGPLLSLVDVAGFLRLTLGAVRKRMYRGTCEIGAMLLENRVCLAGRWFIKREPFMLWIREKSGDVTGSSSTP